MIPVVGERVMWKENSGVVVELIQEPVEVQEGVVAIDWTVVVRDDEGILNWVSLRDLEGYR